MGNKIAFVTGVTGQDGSYLAELLLNKDYLVYGLVRRSSLFNRTRIEQIIRGTNNNMGCQHRPLFRSRF